MQYLLPPSSIARTRTSRRIAIHVGLALWASVTLSQAAVGRPATPAASPVQRADFGRAQPSSDTRLVADSVVAARDNEGAHFIILDKVRARVWVFDPSGRLRASAPALLGAAKGDHTVPGIGDKKISEITPDERTTPAGRFVAEMGESSSRGEDVVWVDYESAVSMHRVVTSNPKERRLQRLATKTAKDNRISYGCINLPKAFYEKWVGGIVSRAPTVIYVLPEAQTLRQVFSFIDAKQRGGVRQAAARSLRAGPPEDGPMPVIDQ